ncbi:SDR family NAD(P)-dependent oxidoreductase [uncultured Amnibacterium sp.]|uniref:SDR family NAD(P)-dependent oxidoreductase n=1 Tax=uncultured Amnibacterium sp. TaxID=1631851 RepID=UPI0035CB6914
MRTALVTGTSSGIGLHTAVGLAVAGFHVIATVRDPSRSDALLAAAHDAGVEVEVVALDVTDAARSAEVVQQAGAIDVLVNNAGRGSVATLEQLTDEDLPAQLDVNLIAVARLTRLVLPGMRERGAGRIVTVTSVGGAVGQPFADAYCAAKFAVEGLMQSLAPVVAPFGVQVSVVEPAAVASAFVENVERPAAGEGGPYGALLDAYLARTAGAFAAAQSPAEAAGTVIEAAITDAPRFRWQTSATAVAFAGRSLADLDGSRVLEVTRSWLV